MRNVTFLFRPPTADEPSAAAVTLEIEATPDLLGSGAAAVPLGWGAEHIAAAVGGLLRVLSHPLEARPVGTGPLLRSIEGIGCSIEVQDLKKTDLRRFVPMVLLGVVCTSTLFSDRRLLLPLTNEAGCELAGVLLTVLGMRRVTGFDADVDIERDPSSGIVSRTEKN